MTIWAIVPMKSLRSAKSRLSEVLTLEERVELTKELLIHTLMELSRSPSIEQTLVVSKDSDALAIARSRGARTLMEHGASDLNPALNRATAVAKGYGASGVLVIPADLPDLSSKDIEMVLNVAGEPPTLVIVPDRNRQGTNALLSIPPGLIDYAFGPESFEKHLERAKHTPARIEIADLPSLAFDLDWPDDLKRMQEARASSTTLKRGE